MTDPVYKHSVANLDDHAIKLLMANPEGTKLLPCLSRPKNDLGTLQPGNANCQTCQAQKNKIRARAMNMAKDCVINADASAILKLKTLLSAATIKIPRTLPNGMQQVFER